MKKFTMFFSLLTLIISSVYSQQVTQNNFTGILVSNGKTYMQGIPRRYDVPAVFASTKEVETNIPLLTKSGQGV